MKLRREPVIATWFLSLFCSNSEHESVVGDLMEQYQQGRGRYWYWKQVLALSVRGLYARIAQRPLTRTDRFPLGLSFGAIVVVVAIAAALQSDVGLIFLVAILAGILFGIFKFVHGNRVDRPVLTDRDSPPIASPRIVRIDSSKIPIGGSVGAGILILVLFTAALHDQPELRKLALPGILAGLLFAAILRLWRKRHPRAISKDWLSIKR